MAGPLRKALGYGGIGLTGLFAYQSYTESRARGHGAAYSLASAAGQGFLWSKFALPMYAFAAAPLVDIAGTALREKMGKIQRTALPFSPYGFQDSETSQTSRARALQAIQASRLNARSYMGQEAGLFATRYR